MSTRPAPWIRARDGCAWCNPEREPYEPPCTPEPCDDCPRPDAIRYAHRTEPVILDELEQASVDAARAQRAAHARPFARTR